MYLLPKSLVLTRIKISFLVSLPFGAPVDSFNPYSLLNFTILVMIMLRNKTDNVLDF